MQHDPRLGLLARRQSERIAAAQREQRQWIGIAILCAALLFLALHVAPKALAEAQRIQIEAARATATGHRP
jgi:hypothetical protein